NRRDENVAHALPDMLDLRDTETGLAVHSQITHGHLMPSVQLPPRSTPPWSWSSTCTPFEVCFPPVCSMFPVIFPPFCTSSVPVISLLVHTTSGVSSVMRVSAFTSTTGTVAVMESEAVTSAVLIPDTVSDPLPGSYSITAPPGKAM